MAKCWPVTVKPSSMIPTSLDRNGRSTHRWILPFSRPVVIHNSQCSVSCLMLRLITANWVNSTVSRRKLQWRPALIGETRSTCVPPMLCELVIWIWPHRVLSKHRQTLFTECVRYLAPLFVSSLLALYFYDG